MKRFSGPLMLLLTAMIWGAAFVAQSVGMDYVGPFTLQSVRALLGGIVLLPVIALMGRSKPKSSAPGTKKDLILGGILCGTLLAVASVLQQYGILYTTVGKAGFITTLYVVLVPIIGLFFRKRVPPLIWLCVTLSVVGLYLLCISGAAAFNRGDLLVMLCALVFSLHIIAIDHFSPRVDGVKLSCIQFLVCGVLCFFPMMLLEHPTAAALLAAWKPIAYAGILSCGVGYTLQVVAQNRTDPTVASLILCMESVFSAVFGWLLLGQGMAARELAGCGLMFASILLAQFADRVKLPSQKS